MIRTGEGLTRALSSVNTYLQMFEDMKNDTLEDFELQNMMLLSRLVTESALEREESRGAHHRSDFSSTDDRNWKRHIIKRREQDAG